MQNKNNITGSRAKEHIPFVYPWFDAKALEGGVLSHDNNG